MEKLRDPAFGVVFFSFFYGGQSCRVLAGCLCCRRVTAVVRMFCSQLVIICLRWQAGLMKGFFLLLSLIGISALAQSYQTIDRVDGWLIERKLDRQQNHVCRASLPGGGSWFSTRVRLDFNDSLVVPDGLTPPNKESLVLVREALRLCRSSLLYF